jgi:6-pyruvoyl-tetrahydropterin synthase
MEQYVLAYARFSAGHVLPGTAHAHPHGHAYSVRLTALGASTGEEPELAHLRQLCDELNLRPLGEMLPAAPQTATGIATQLAERLLSRGVRVVEVEVTDETGSGAMVRREPR